MPRKTRLAVIFTVAMIASASMPMQAWAGRLSVHEAAESDQYGRKFGGMLGRGALNVVTSFVDVIVNTVNETRNGPPVVGTFTGLGRGLGCGVLRLGSGAIDIVTSWVPGFNGAPVSASYTDCFDRSHQQMAMPVAAPLQQQIQPEFSYAQPQEFEAQAVARQPVEIPVYQEQQAPAPAAVAKDKPRWSK